MATGDVFEQLANVSDPGLSDERGPQRFHPPRPRRQGAFLLISRLELSGTQKSVSLKASPPRNPCTFLVPHASSI